MRKKPIYFVSLESALLDVNRFVVERFNKLAGDEKGILLALNMDGSIYSEQVARNYINKPVLDIVSDGFVIFYSEYEGRNSCVFKNKLVSALRSRTLCPRYFGIKNLSKFGSGYDKTMFLNEPISDASSFDDVIKLARRFRSEGGRGVVFLDGRVSNLKVLDSNKLEYIHPAVFKSSKRS